MVLVTLMRRILTWLRRHPLAVDAITAALGIYLAAGMLLRGASEPSESFWEPWSGWFIALLVSALYVPAYAFYRAVDAHGQAHKRIEADAARRSAELHRDLLVYCQRAVAEIADQCRDVTLNELAAHIWICREDGRFVRCARFFLPHDHKGTGVDWRRGKGVAGMAWETNQNVLADLGPVHEQRGRLGEERFDALPAEERFGMTYRELQDSEVYTGVIAIRLFSTDAVPSLLGVFLIDYTGQEGFGCVVATTRRRQLRSILGACERLLTENRTDLET